VKSGLYHAVNSSRPNSGQHAASLVGVFPSLGGGHEGRESDRGEEERNNQN